MKPNREELGAIAGAFRTSHGASTSAPPPSSVLLSPPIWPLTWQPLLKATVTDALPDIAAVLHEGCKGIFLSLGAQGALFARRVHPTTPAAASTEHGVHIKVTHVPGLPVKIASLVGAGDCSVAGAVAALAAGKNEVEALVHGAAAATISIQSMENVPNTLSQEAILPFVHQARRLVTEAEFRCAT